MTKRSPSPGGRRAPVPARGRSERARAVVESGARRASGCRRECRLSRRFQLCTGADPTAPARLNARLDSARCRSSSTATSSVPFGTNCYVVRAERGAPEAVVIDPGDDPTELRLELARMGAARRRSCHAHALATTSAASPISPKAPAPRSTCAAGEARRSRTGADARRGDARRAARPGAHRCSSGDETLTVAGITFERVDVPGHSHGARRVPRRRRALRGRRPLRGLDRPLRPARRRLGDAARVHPLARRPLPARDRRLPGPRARDDARARTRVEPVPARAPRRPR